MNLELLPNEIFLDLFEYFDGISLLRQFYGLNSRFNSLLYKQYRFYCFRFNRISKRTFDMICQQHLPFITDHVVSLRLSDFRQTVGQINLFFSYIPSLKQFTQLRSLTIWNLHSSEILLKVLNECHYLNNLTYLEFDFCTFSNVQEEDFQFIVNKIWNLPKLTHFFSDITIEKQKISYAPTVISSSLECITIKNIEFNWSKLNRLFQCTPRLGYLSTTVVSAIDDNYISSSLSTLTKWNLEIFSKFDTFNINVFFQNMPNLCYLNVILQWELIDGHQWKQIIRNYLPKLKIFRLKMIKIIWYEDNIEERANALIDSFRDSFWIDEHQWFVRCFIRSRILRLFTHSYRLGYYETRCNSWKSTCPHDDYQKFQYDMNRTCNHEFLERSALSHLHLPNIKYLKITFPINDQFWTNISSLNQLDLLTISHHADTFQSQLQALLDRAPHLRRLSIGQDASLPLQRSLFKYTHTSIFLLDLHACYYCFNEEECLTLSRSPLGIHCEALFIRLNNRQSIISLVRNMTNLRALNIYWNDDKVFQHSQQINNNNNENQNIKSQVLDELVQWLKDELPSTYLISADPHYTHDISIWI